MTLRKLERELGAQGARHAADSETLGGLLRRITRLERQLQVIEPTPVPRISRRRPLGRPPPRTRDAWARRLR